MKFTVTRYGANSHAKAFAEGLTEDEALNLVRLATGLPFGGVGHTHKLIESGRHRIIHVAPPLGYEPGTPNETIIVEATNAD